MDKIYDMVYELIIIIFLNSQGLIYIRDLHLDDSLFPAGMPVGTYIIQILLVTKRSGQSKVIFDFQMYGYLKHRSYGIV